MGYLRFASIAHNDLLASTQILLFSGFDMSPPEVLEPETKYNASNKPYYKYNSNGLRDYYKLWHIKHGFWYTYCYNKYHH